MPFLAPLLLFGAVFASAPIIIHLLNRRRFKLVEWAPMQYLKLTLRTNRRRLQLEQWILLAIRTIVILLLIFAVARPFLSGNAAAAWLSVGGRTSRVILIDDSLSMGLTAAGESAFTRAKEQAATLIGSIGSQDALTVVTSSSLDRPMVRDSVLSEDEAAALAEDVRALEPVESANSWSAALSELAELFEGTAYNSKEARLFTDLRASGWSADAAEQAGKLEAMGVKLVVVNVGQGSSGNAALAGLEQASGVALANTPIQFTATIDTDGDPQFKVDYATLAVDGVESPIKLPDIAAGQRGVELKLTHTFQTPGQHTVELRLPDDAMAGDNSRSLVVDVAESVRILLVDGEPGIAARDSEVFYLAQVLFSGSTPIRVIVLPDSEWLDQPGVGNYDLVVLANIEKLPAERIDQLKLMVQSGMGLMVFTGDQIDPSAYNSLMYAGGAGLLPGQVELGESIDAEGLIIEAIADTPLERVLGLPERILSLAVPSKVSRVVLPREEGRTDTRVLARWSAPGSPPAAVEKRVGRGRVVLWTVTADNAWSDWPKQPSYMLAMRDTALAIAGVGDSSGNLTAGAPIRQRVSASNPPTRADAVLPGDETAQQATIDRTEANRPRIVWDNTHRAGLYKLSWDMPGRDEQLEKVFALSPDTRESDLRQLSTEELEQMLPGVDLTLIELEEGASGGAQREIWRTLALALLGFVLFESAFAAWVGREH